MMGSSAPDTGEIANRLRFRMEADSFSLREAAPQIGVGFSTLGRILRGGGTIPRTRRKLERWLSSGPSARATAGAYDEYDMQLLDWLKECQPNPAHCDSDFCLGVVRGFEIITAQIEQRHHRKYIRLPRDSGIEARRVETAETGSIEDESPGSRSEIAHNPLKTGL